MRSMRCIIVILLVINLSACLGSVVGTAADVAIEVVKVPFKVIGAAVDVVSGDDDDEKKQLQAKYNEEP